MCLISIDTECDGEMVFCDGVDKVEIGIGEDIGDSIWNLFPSMGRVLEGPFHYFLKEFPHKRIMAAEVVPKVAALNPLSD